MPPGAAAGCRALLYVVPPPFVSFLMLNAYSWLSLDSHISTVEHVKVNHRLESGLKD